MKIVYFMGGLGNQLFQYVFMKNLKELYPNERICFSIRSYLRLHTHGYFLLRNVDGKRQNFYNSKKFILIKDENKNHENKANCLYIGYWQDIKYIKNITPDDIKRVIVNANKVSNSPYYKIIKETKNSVSIHVRRGDFLGNKLYSGICTPEYYKNSVDLINQKIQNPHFFVFSDDIEWCKENLDFSGAQVTFVRSKSYGKKSAMDMLLMGECQHNIIANSSYSWWGQFLNNNKEKIVVAPKKWVNEACDAFPDGKVNLNSFPYMMCI